METVGKMLLFLGLLFVPISRLLGAIIIQRRNFTLYVPLVTMLAISLLLTILIKVIPHLFRG